MILITFESRDKTCSKLEKTWFLLVNRVAKKQLSEWKKTSTSRGRCSVKKGSKKFRKIHKKAPAMEFFLLEVQVSGVFMWILQNFKNTSL